MPKCHYRECQRDARRGHTMCASHTSAGISRAHYNRMQRERDQRADVRVNGLVAAIAAELGVDLQLITDERWADAVAKAKQLLEKT